MSTTNHLTDAEIKRFCLSRRSLGERQLEVLDHLRECEICNRKYWEIFQVARVPLEIELDGGCTLVIDKDESGRCTMLIHDSDN
jgi:hypothetical protein